MKKLLLLSSTLLLAACATTNNSNVDTMEGMDHGMIDHGENSASEDMVADRLNNSPRHHEWVAVDNNGKIVHTWVVYPERSDNAPVVILLHENRGLNDWTRSMADQVAEAGYIAVAPDLLSGFSDDYEKTSDFPDEDAARNAIGELDMTQVVSDMQAVVAYAKTIPSGNGKIASAGFCWGGSRSYQLATVQDDLDAALVFYGTGPEDADAYSAISAPVFGFYGGDDQRVNATIDQSEMYMSQEGKSYDYVIYEGAGHAFMRSGEDPTADPANVTARNEAWERMKQILSDL